MIAVYTVLPARDPPVKTSALSGVDSLYSMVQMPGGHPRRGRGNRPWKNAWLFAAEKPLNSDLKLRSKLLARTGEAGREEKVKKDIGEACTSPGSTRG